MEEYRLYLFTPPGLIGRAVELRCSDHAEALRLLQAHADRHPILELSSRGAIAQAPRSSTAC